MATRSRRRLLASSLDALVAMGSGVRRQPSFNLADLPTLGDEVLGRLVPAIVDASAVRANAGRFEICKPDGDADVLFEQGSREEDVWSLMDGRTTIATISTMLARDWQETEAAAFATTRAVFLGLVQRQICLPCNPLE